MVALDISALSGYQGRYWLHGNIWPPKSIRLSVLWGTSMTPRRVEFFKNDTTDKGVVNTSL